MPPTPPTRRNVPNPYLDYGRSYASQGRGNPDAYKAVYGLGAGATGSILAALVARALDASPMNTALAAGGGGLAGGLLGTYMGDKERHSQNTRLNALRRFGIDNPAEYELLMNAPLAGKSVVQPGVRV